MQAAEQAMSTVTEQRRKEIVKSMARVRAIEQKKGVNREALVEIKAVLLELVAKTELFPSGDFPVDKVVGGYNPFYRISEDDDHRYALYMATGRAGKKDVPPHDHCTWAVITSIQGDEENRFYERTDDGASPGKAQLKQVTTEMVRPGTGVCLMPDDIHSIHVDTDSDTLHLHLYGLANEYRPEMVVYDMEEGSYRQFPTHPNIREAR